MRIFDRMGRGWELGLQSLRVILDYPKLLLFPVLSGVSMCLILLSFGGVFLGLSGFDVEVMESIFARMEESGEWVFWVSTFLFYLITYLIVVFFNVALVHNAHRIFAGQEPSVRVGLSFAMRRLPQIIAWAALAATVGMLLKAIEERVGSLVTSLLGFAWSLATYFVVPILAAEEVDPIEALKRSSRTIRNKWGEAVGAGFSLGIFFILGIFCAIGIGFVIGAIIHPGVGAFFGFLAFLLTIVVNSAAQNVFLAAAYDHSQGHTPEQFESETLDGLFMPKK